MGANGARRGTFLANGGALTSGKQEQALRSDTRITVIRWYKSFCMQFIRVPTGCRLAPEDDVPLHFRMAIDDMDLPLYFRRHHG